MSVIRLTRELLADGFTHAELASQAKSGIIQHIRRGAYECAMTPSLQEAGVETAAARHRRLVQATVRVTAPTAVVSHLSAAVMHRLPVLASSLHRVQLTRADVGGGKNRGGVHLHATPLDECDVVEVDGIATTSLARTVADLGRAVAFGEAVMAGDAALQQGLTSELLSGSLLRSARWPGIAGARRAAAFLDARSESPGESLSRAALHLAMVPPPTPQFEVRSAGGVLVGRCDFGWEEQRTLGEFDGRVKYGRLLRPGETAGEAMYREKVREDALRDLGWQVVRWTWAELGTPDVIVERLLRAFARGVLS